MSDTEADEIEYLDEDAEIVKKCVQATQINVPLLKPSGGSKPQAPVQTEKRKKKPQEGDSSDYDPEEDLRQIKKRKTQTNVKKHVDKPAKQPLPSTPVAQAQRQEVVEISEDEPSEVKIYDYDDPLCLSVKYWGKDSHDSQVLNKWNDLCLQRLQESPEGLNHGTGYTVASKRVIVLRNVTNSMTRKVDTTMWSKTLVENESGEKKTEVCQSVLPKFREKMLLNINTPCLQNNRGNHVITTVVLAKELHKDEDVLVAYEPADGVSSVYKLVEPPSTEIPEASKKRHLLQTVRTRICAPCYQMSWRPARAKSFHNEIICPICRQPFLSVYNLLSHVRTHSSAQVCANKRDLSRVLSKIVDYHYMCRICQKEYEAIRETKEHVKTHLCKEKFHCEVGNHFTQ